MRKTKIEWVRNSDGTQGYTWNPITGCLGPGGTSSSPQRCSYCYARKLAKGRLKNLYLSNLGEISAKLYKDFENIIPYGDPDDPFTPRYWPDRAIEPYKLKKSSTIFICSMGELFGKLIPEDWINNILDTCWELSEHTFQILTKNPRRPYLENRKFPNNVWFGITMDGNNDENWNRLFHLLHYDEGEHIQAKIKFVSLEPLLENIEIEKFDYFGEIDWLIIGAQTNPYRPPKKEWVEKIIKEARDKNIPIFLKKNLKLIMGDLIQEFPE